MATIEERAEKWVEEYMIGKDYIQTSWKRDLIAAYLAGSAQTQKDYLNSQHGKTGIQGYNN